MGKSIRNINPEDTDVADRVAQSLGIAPKQQEDGPKKPIKQKPVETSDAVAQSLGLKKKVGGDESGQDGVPTPSESPLGVQGGDMFGNSMKAYQDRTLNKQNVDILAQTDVGKKMGLDMLSPDAREVFAQAHNGPKKADLVNSINGIIDNFYPQSQDPKLNQKRFEIKQSVLQGNQDAIVRLKSNIVQSLQKQIDQRESEISGNSSGDPEGYQAQQYFVDRDAKIQELRNQQRQVSSIVDEYGKQSLVSSKDMEAWLKLDAEHPNIQTSIAAEKLGKMSAEKYGADRTTPNQEHDRMTTGFRLIMQSLQMDINEALTYGIPSKNPELLKKAQDKVNTLARYKEMYDKLDTEQFPDVGLDRTARFLGDIIAEKHPNKLIRYKEDVEEAALIANERNPGFLEKYGGFVDMAAEKQDQGTFIPRGGGKLNELVGGIVTSAAQNALDLLKWKDRAVGSSETDKIDLSRETSPGLRGTTQYGTERTKIVYDKEGQAYREMPNENYGTLPWNNFFRFAGSSLPGLAEFIATEGVAKGYAQALSFGRMSKAATEFTGLVGASYLTSYNSNREFADANIDDKSGAGEAKKIILANFLTMANAGVFHALNASPSKIVEKAISKSVAPDVMKLFEENSWEQLSQKTASSFIKDKILPRAKAIVEKFGESAKGGMKIGAASVIDQKVHDLAGIMTNTDFKPSTIEDNARAFVQQALLMTMVGGVVGMISTGEVPHATKEALHQAGLYAPQYIDQINERVQNGELEPHKANGMIAMIKTMGEELGNVAHTTTADGTPLTVTQKRDIAIANFRKRAAAQMEENGLPINKEKVASEADAEIKNIRAQNNWQAIEETPVFKSIKEVDESGKKGEKVKAMDDIDPAKQYNYIDENGQEITGSGADLIKHLETGDIYEKEKPNDKVSKTEKATDSEGEDKKPSPDQEGPIVEPQTIEVKLAGEIKVEKEEYKPNIRDDYFAKADFFTPEEKSMFETLDDAGKDKMIDDKRAELKERETTDPLEKGKEAIKKAADAGKLGVMAEGAKANPEQFLKDVADQALGFTRDSEGNRVKSDIPDAEKATREQYGNDIVDAAKELYPEEQEPRSEEKQDTAPEDNTKKIEALQGSYDRLIASGMDPNDSEMKNLKSRIENLSSLKTQEDANVKTQQSGSSQKEANAEEGGQEGQQKTDEKGNVLTTESDQGAGEPPAGKPAPASEESKSPIVGIRDSIVNADRVHKGLEPLLKEFTRHWQDNWNQIKANIRKGFSPRKFIEETALKIQKEDNDNKGRKSKRRSTFSDYDYATLLFDRLDIQNNIARTEDVMKEAKEKGDTGAETAAQQILDNYNQQLIQNDTVGRRMKSESGRALSAIQMMTKMDGELVSWTKDLTNLYHGTMPEALKGFVERIEGEYKAKTEELRQHYEEQLKKAADDAFKKGKTEAGKSKKTDKSVKAQGKDLADKIRGLRDKFGTNKGGIAQSNIFGLPIAIADTALVTIANLVEGGAKLIDAINEALKDVKFDSDKDRNAFIASLQNAEDPNSEQAKRAGYLEDIQSIAKENDATTLVPDAVKSVKNLMTSYVKDESVKTLDELVKKTHEDLKETLPDITEKDLRDAFSGYGAKSDTEGKVKSDLTKLREQARKVSEYQELLKKPAGETLAQEQKRAEKARKLFDEVQGYMREMGIEETPPPTTTEGKKAVALDKSKERMKNIIKSLDQQILAGERKERNGVTPDAELTVLRAERARLSAELSEIDDSGKKNKSEYTKLETERNRQLKKVEDLKKKLETLELGQKPDAGESKEATKDTPEIEELKSKIKEAEQKISKDKADRKSQYNKLESERNRQLKAVSDLKEKLKNLKEGNRPEPKKSEPKADTPEIEALKKEVKQADEDLRKVEAEQRRRGMTPEQRIKRIEDTLNRQILNYEKQIREGVDPLRPRDERPTTKQIEHLRKRKNELKKEVDGLRRDADPNYSAQQRALDDYNERLQKKIWEMESKLESGDLEKEEPAPKVDFSRDERSLTLESRIRKLERDFYGARRAGELANRSWLQKAMSLAATVKRAFVLSRISTFGRLIAADIWSNGVFEPAESAAGLVGYGLTKVGFAKKLSQQAERYGVSTWGDVKAVGKGELGALGSLLKARTWKDFVADVKNGHSELSLMYEDPQHIDVPKELRDHWQNIEHGLESISRSHGAVKGLSKRMEFTRSYIIRKEAARRKGADVDNPVVQASIGSMAFQDAMRHVLMEDNLASKGYQWVINKLESKGLSAQFLALGMKELMPIVKIPTNMVLNAVRATVGTPLAGGMIVARGIAEVMSKGNSEWGISKLTPEQSDALLRNFRKGNVGMSLMLAGFFAPNMFGAAHYYQKGSEQPEGLEEGEVKFFGVTIPKWLADNPYLVTAKIGASLRASFDYYTDEKSQSFVQAATSSLLHTAAGAAEETPLIGSPAQLYQAATGYGGNWFWYNLLKSTLEPGILQEIAEDTDNREGWTDMFMGTRIKRKPENIGEALKTGFPGLREQVQEK